MTKANEGVFVNEFRTLIDGCENPAEHVGMDNQFCGETEMHKRYKGCCPCAIYVLPEIKVLFGW